MKYIWVIAFTFLLSACIDPQEYTDEQQAEYERQTELYNRQQAESARQLRKSAEQLKLADGHYLKIKEQNARYDILLDRWEKQADRYDAILDKWEKQANNK